MYDCVEADYIESCNNFVGIFVTFIENIYTLHNVAFYMSQERFYENVNKITTFSDGNLGPPIMGFNFNARGFLMLMTSEYCCLISLVIIWDLCILGSLQKLLVL